MCIFCGGACGGAGDALLALGAVAAPMAVLRIQSRLASRRKDTGDETDDVEEDEDVDSEAGGDLLSETYGR